jgi:hypothetical protein
LALRLPPVRNQFLANMATLFQSPINRHCSHISLGWDGTVVSHCGQMDAGDLSVMKPATIDDPPELESVVAEIVGQAWLEFRAGNLPAAGLTLGDSPESEVFIVAPPRARSTRWWRIFNGATVVLMMAALILQLMSNWRPAWMAWMDGMKPVSVNEAEVRAFLNDTTPNPDPKKFKFNSPGLAVFTCLVLPSTNLFSPEGLRAMRNEVAGGDGFESLKQSSWRAQSAFGVPLLRRALADGWINWSDLGIRPEDSAAFLRTNSFPVYSRDNLDYFLIRSASWSWVKKQKFDVLRIQSDAVTQLRLLQTVNCLDLIDREKLVRQIAAVQTLSGTPLGQPPIHDWRDVRGLFFTPGWPALQDTYFSLAALQILGGLDTIDRDACVKGILARYRGRGYFTSPNSGGFNEYHIDGSARDTIAAFEALRILGALDRVKDLDKWQFRVASRNSSKPDANGLRTPTWNEVEAWVCQRRLERILLQRKENPHAPPSSLLQPREN